jgi:hypothetical protein
MRRDVRGDARSGRVAVVPDAVVNPAAGARDRLADLAMSGWGVVALPPPDLPAEVTHPLVAAVVDQVIALLDGGYEVALLPASDDPGMRRFVAALAASGRTVADLA